MAGAATEFGKTDLGVCACMSALAFALVDGCGRGCDNPVPEVPPPPPTARAKKGRHHQSAIEKPAGHPYHICIFGKRNGVFNPSPRVNCQEQRRCALQHREYSSTLRLRSAKCRLPRGPPEILETTQIDPSGLAATDCAPARNLRSSAARSRSTDEGPAHHVFQARKQHAGTSPSPRRQTVMH